MHNFSAEELNRQLNQGAFDHVNAALEQLFQQAQIPLAFWQLKCKLKTLEGKQTEAIAVLEAALGYFPSEASLHHKLAHLYLQQKNLILAGEHFHAARAFDPESLQHTLELSEYFLLLGQRRDALLYLQEAMKMSPQPEQLFLILGHILYLFGRHQDTEAAWLQSLESGQSIIAAQVNLLRLYLSQRNFSQALQCGLNLKTCSNLFIKEPEIWAEACHLWALEAYWQGNLSTARELWRESLANHVSAEAFYALTLAVPLIYQERPEQDKWTRLLKEGIEVLKQSQLPAPKIHNLPDFLPPVFFKAEELALKQSVNQWLEAFFEQKTFKAQAQNQGLRLGFIVSDLDKPDVQAYLQAIKQAPEHKRIELSLYYFQPESLPKALIAWESEAFQLPAHNLALNDYFAQEPVDALAFLDFTPELYILALQRAAAIQILMPTLSHSSGLKSMDYVLCHNKTELDLKLYSETPLPSPAPVYLIQQQPCENPTSRQDWNLPRLGHLYFIPAEAQHWGLEIDALIWHILQNDRKAFIIGLQTPGSTLHTHIMQRHETSLKGRQHRVRWINLKSEHVSEFLSLVDLVIAPPDMNEFWAFSQALLQEIPVISCQNAHGSVCQVNALLKDLSLDDLIVSTHEELVTLASKLLKDKQEHVMLKERLKEARQHLLTTQTKRAEDILQSIYQRLSKPSLYE